MVSGREFVRPIGKSWRGDPFKPEADTSLPVFVHDVKFKEPQHLEPNEGELLMGMPENVTSGNSVSPRLRLRCIGNGWDLTVVDLFLRHSAIIPSPASKTSNFCDYEKKEKINSPTATVTQVLSEEHEELQALLVIFSPPMPRKPSLRLSLPSRRMSNFYLYFSSMIGSLKTPI